MRGRHVHVRLEEEFTGEFPFCIGVTLGRLAVRTCDQHWKPQHRNVKRSEDGSLEKGSSNRRLLLVESFAIYWNGEMPGTGWEVDLSDESMVSQFRDNIETEQEVASVAVGHCQSKQHDYVLAPATIEARVTLRDAATAKESRIPELEVRPAAAAAAAAVATSAAASAAAAPYIRP